MQQLPSLSEAIAQLLSDKSGNDKLTVEEARKCVTEVVARTLKEPHLTNPIANLGKTNVPRTWFIDVDGTLLNFQGTLDKAIRSVGTLLDGVREFVDAIHAKGDQLVVITGRPESMREITHKQLIDNGIAYHKLIMDIGIGSRIIVNDLKNEDGRMTAAAICVRRNAGVGTINEMLRPPEALPEPLLDIGQTKNV